MRAHTTNLLAKRPNKFTLPVAPVAASVSRNALELVSALKAHATSVGRWKHESIAMLRSFIARGTVLGGLWASLAAADIPARAPIAVARIIEQVPLTIEVQWKRVTAIVQAGVDAIQRLAALHAAAARQIDAAEYALAQLIHDLRTAMPLPPDVAPLRAILAEAERTAPRRMRRGGALAA
jgi:hypothetical protein